MNRSLLKGLVSAALIVALCAGALFGRGRQPATAHALGSDRQATRDPSARRTLVLASESDRAIGDLHRYYVEEQPRGIAPADSERIAALVATGELIELAPGTRLQIVDHHIIASNDSELDSLGYDEFLVMTGEHEGRRVWGMGYSVSRGS